MMVLIGIQTINELLGRRLPRILVSFSSVEDWLLFLKCIKRFGQTIILQFQLNQPVGKGAVGENQLFLS